MCVSKIGQEKAHVCEPFGPFEMILMASKSLQTMVLTTMPVTFVTFLKLPFLVRFAMYYLLISQNFTTKVL